MSGKTCASSSWNWPVKLDEYDWSPELKSEEAETIRANQPSLANGVPPSVVLENCARPRLMKPLEDVCTHIELQRNYWANLKAMVLRDVAARGRSYWGWTEDEWIESIREAGHEKPSVASVAYLLCEFNALHRLGRRNFLFHGVAYRVFGRKRMDTLFAEVREMLLHWGYRTRMAAVYVPRVVCELLVTNRSPHLEDLTLELFETVERRRASPMSTWCLAALSKILAVRGIIPAPIMRMNKPRPANPRLKEGVPEQWIQAAKYWYENGTRSPRLRRADYYFLLCVGRWLGAKHPEIVAPEQWDRTLAVECLTMITNLRCGDWRAPGEGLFRWKRHYGRPLKPATKIQNYTAVRTFFADLQQ